MEDRKVEKWHSSYVYLCDLLQHAICAVAHCDITQ